MTHFITAKKYLQLLEAADIEGIIMLFNEEGTVHSPLYGAQPAREFYRQLGADTSNSKIMLDGIFGEAGRNRLALYFHYQWTLKNGQQAAFEVVDIIEFDQEGKIKN